jgi:glutaredoxin
VGSIRRVELYFAPECHLCESARRVLENVRADIPFELEEIDITGDHELERRYRERLPVVLIDGEEVFTYFVYPEALRQRVGR